MDTCKWSAGVGFGPGGLVDEGVAGDSPYPVPADCGRATVVDRIALLPELAQTLADRVGREFADDVPGGPVGHQGGKQVGGRLTQDQVAAHFPAHVAQMQDSTSIGTSGKEG